jgi:hypothetical protein
MHFPLFVGLISLFAGSTLPEDIATSTRRLVAKGHDILGLVPAMKNPRLLEFSKSACPQTRQQTGSLQGRHHPPVGTACILGPAGFPADQGTRLPGAIHDR